MPNLSTPFLEALRFADCDAVKRLLLQQPQLAIQPFDVAACTNSPLMLVVRVPNRPGHGESVAADEAQDAQRASLVGLLIDHGADPNQVYKRGIRPMHMAARYGQSACLAELLRRGAEPDARSSEGDTALHRAANLGHLDAVAVLVQAGADTSIRNRKGHTAKDRARTKGHNEILRLFADADR